MWTLCLLPALLASQRVPIDVDDWETLDSTDRLNQDTCEHVGGFDYSTNTIKMYGGYDHDGHAAMQAKYVFNTTTETFVSQNTTGTSFTAFSTEINSAQRIGRDNADNIIYYYDRASEAILGINMTDDTRAEYATFQSGSDLSFPALCIDDATGTLYSVGSKTIHTCTLVKDTPPQCSSVDIDSYYSQDILESSCVYYDGSLFIFGGMNENWDTNTDVYKCNPAADNDCTNTTSFVVARAGMRAVKIECFDNQYVALIGGNTDNGNASSVVELYDLEMETVVGDWDADLDKGMSTPRKHFVAVFDPVNEALWAFGGNNNTAGTSCTNRVDVTRAGRGHGLCATFDPTIDPTLEPTIDPTSDPTQDPTTSNPTTSEPSDAPTTGKPTKKPSSEGGLVYEPDIEGHKITGGAYGVIITMLILVCCIIFCCFFWFSREERQHSYGRMPVEVAVAGGTVVPMVAPVVVVYCGICSKATPCSCDSCNKCGKGDCSNECGKECGNCKTTSCDGNACLNK